MLGERTTQQKQNYTLVLKGNIGLSQAIFPVNSRGSLLDVLSRKALWENGFNYGHDELYTELVISDVCTRWPKHSF